MPGRSWLGWVVPPLAGLRIVLLRVNPEGMGLTLRSHYRYPATANKGVARIISTTQRGGLGPMARSRLTNFGEYGSRVASIDPRRAPRSVTIGRHHPEWDPRLAANIRHPRQHTCQRGNSFGASTASSPTVQRSPLSIFSDNHHGWKRCTTPPCTRNASPLNGHSAVTRYATKGDTLA